MKRLFAAIALTLLVFVSCSGAYSPEPFYLPPVPQEAVQIETAGLAIVAGNTSAFAVLPDGSLWGWGSNSSGQLGNGTTADWSVPHLFPIHIMDDVAYVSAGGRGSRSDNVGHVLAIRTDGSLWAWGRNTQGQLGDGTTEGRLRPVMIMEDVIAVSAGASHTMAIRTDGSLWGWGSNNAGKLGDGTYENRSSPVHIMDDVVAVSAGYRHTLAIDINGTVWAWGTGRLLGIEELGHRNTPVRIMENIIAISAGGAHSLAICINHSLWVWGTDYSGQLGTGIFTDKRTPIRMFDNVVAVAAGYHYSIIVKADGSLWSWGHNNTGQLGDGTIYNNRTPMHIMDDVAAISTGGVGRGVNFAVKTNGSTWAWGCNFWGQIGDGYYGIFNNRHSPVEIFLSDLPR